MDLIVPIDYSYLFEFPYLAGNHNDCPQRTTHDVSFKINTYLITGRIRERIQPLHPCYFGSSGGRTSLSFFSFNGGLWKVCLKAAMEAGMM